jgi:DNA-binding transcriptional LysR family regulator
MPRKAGLNVELLETFVRLLENDGDAALTARQLGLNQPSMSKRMAMLQRSGRVRRSWLQRQGKTWYATEEGQRLLPAVREIVRRYRRLLTFVNAQEIAAPEVSFACGQRAATDFALEAVRRFRAEHPDITLRLSTLRGDARILGVASGQLDLATVTADEAHIRELARRPMHIETLFEEPLMLACARRSDWTAAVEALPDGQVRADHLARLPLILPDPDSGVRRQLEPVVAGGKQRKPVNVVLEVGGWSALLAYVAEGMGVGVAIESACREAPGKLVLRRLDRKVFPAIATRLICCKDEDTGKPELSADAERFRQALLQAAWDLHPVPTP